MSDWTSRTILVSACLLAAVDVQAGPPPDTCVVSHFDGTAENALGVNPGFEGEYCQFLDLTTLDPELCSNNDPSAILSPTVLTPEAKLGPLWIDSSTVGFTRTGGSNSLTWTDRIRQADGQMNPPGGVLMGTPDIQTPSIPVFPGFIETEVPAEDRNDSASGLLDETGFVYQGNGIYVCAGWNGDAGDQALPTDLTPGSPIRNIWGTFDQGQLWESVQSFPGFEDIRAALVKARTGRFGGPLSGRRRVPEIPTDARGMATIRKVVGSSRYRGRIRHRVLRPTRVALFRGRKGQTGPMVQNLGNGQDPVVIDFVPMNANQFAQDLASGRLYVRVDSVDFPDGEIRGQIAEALRRIPSDTFDVVVGLSAPSVEGCLDVHHSKTNDNIVDFDLVEDPLDSFTTGTRALVDENEIPLGGPSSSVQFGVRSDLSAPGDLFPSGFNDPDKGDPLVDACLKIGTQDPLARRWELATLRAHLTLKSGDVEVLPRTDITDQLNGIFDGIAEINVPGVAGQGVDRVQLTFELEDSQIFTDGFESGDTSAWTN